jgi:demethylmenaquinone methyltransferase / 2-methoxy-6-polyprenyl-1,4-benzoquinol methylase
LYRLTDRNRSIGEMFSSIAPRYDFLNRLLSLGVDRRWRRLAVAETVPSAGGRFLDVATGTADMALEIMRQKGAGASVAGVDLSVEMMRVGKGKCARAGQSRSVAFLRAPGECLPFRDGVFDSACVAFGIRNVADRERCLREMCRAVRPGGRVVVLEFSSPPGTVFAALYRFYFRSVLPRTGVRLRVPARVGFRVPGASRLCRKDAGGGLRFRDPPPADFRDRHPVRRGAVTPKSFRRFPRRTTPRTGGW